MIDKLDGLSKSLETNNEYSKQLYDYLKANNNSNTHINVSDDDVSKYLELSNTANGNLIIASQFVVVFGVILFIYIICKHAFIDNISL